MRSPYTTIARALLICCSAVLPLQNSTGEIIDDGDWTTDTATGLQWLDLDETWGNSDAQIRTRLEVGGDLYQKGWHWATRSEVRTFWSNAGVVEAEEYPDSDDPATLDYSIAIADLMELVKGARTAGSANFVPLDYHPMRGITADGPDAQNGYSPFLNRFFYPALASGRWYGVAWSGYGVDRSEPSPDMGYWLKRPIPSDPVIAVIGVQSDEPKQFSWVPLRDLQEGEQFYFSDAGYFDSLGAFHDGGSTAEWLVRYTVPPGGLPAGAVQKIEAEFGTDYEYITGTNFGEDRHSFLLATAGDQIVVFQSNDDPGEGTDFGSSDFRPIFAFNSNSTSWEAATSPDLESSNLPPGFRDGVDAVAVGQGPSAGDEWDDVRYEGPTTGTPLALLVAITDASNWVGSATIQSGGSNNGVSTFNVIGVTKPEIAVFDGPDISGMERADDIGSADFGNVDIELTSSTRTFTIRNVGAFDLTGISVTSTNPAEFAVDVTGTASSLANFETTTFSVTFATGTAGPATGVIQISSNDADENPFSIPVTGTALIPPPVVTASDSYLPVNATELTISGTTFDGVTPENNTVVFSPSGTGTVTASTTTSLTVTGLTGLVGGPLNAAVTTNGQSSASQVQVATVLNPPAVTETTTILPVETTTVTITGTNFDDVVPGNNLVTFSPSGTGTVTSATSTSLTVSGISGLSFGPLNAVVETLGQSSGVPVQVAGLVAPPTVTSRSLYLSPDSDTIIIYGGNFDANTPSNNVVSFSPTGTGVVTAATPTQLTVTGLSGLDLGSLSVTVTVLTGEALSSGDPVEIGTVVNQPTVTHVADFGGNGGYGQYSSQALVNGHPAIAYYGSGDGNLHFARNSAPDGSGTWDVVVLDYAGQVGSHCSLAVIGGRPAISYYDESNDDLKYVRANDADGISWPQPVTVDSTDDIGQFSSLREVSGHPAIAYYDTTNRDLRYVRALDSFGVSWATPVMLDGDAALVGTYISMEIVNGHPAIAYYDATNDDLKYVRANDPLGLLADDWPLPQVLDADANTSGTWGDLTVVDGYPAVSYAGSTGLRYIRASDASGTVWNAPLTLDTAARHTSLAIVNGFPAISYARGSDDLWFVRATDAQGGAWSAPIVLDDRRSGGTYGSLLVVDGSPAISYTEGIGGAGGLAYLHATDANGTTWSSPQSIGSQNLSGRVGEHSSQAIVNGHPAICYYDDEEEGLRYVRANDPLGTSWGTPIVVKNSNDDIGKYCSLAVINGLPAISYYNADDDDLEFIRASDPDGTTWGLIESVDTTGNVGLFTSLAEVNGRPSISYFDSTNGALKFAQASNGGGSIWSSSGLEVVDTSGGSETVLLVVDGRPGIAYNAGGLKFVWASNISGSSWGNPVAADPATTSIASPSLAIVNGNPAISYHDNTTDQLKYVRATNNRGGAWGAAMTVDSGGIVGEFSSLALIDGHPAISYWDRTNADLKYVRATDVDGSAWGTPEVFDGSAEVGEYTSLIEVNGEPGISYYDHGERNLKWATSGIIPDAPTVVQSYAGLAIDATSLVIHGTGFDSSGLASNSVSFTPAGVGTITAVTDTALTVTGISGLVGGPLSAVVTSQGQESGNPVQVASVVAPVTVIRVGYPEVQRTELLLSSFVYSDYPAGITDRGVVLSLTSENAAPEIGGANVLQLSGTPGVGEQNFQATGLAAGEQYSVRAYATTALGVTYSTVSTRSTVANGDPNFDGYAIGGGYETTISIAEAVILSAATDPDGDELSISAIDGISAQGGTVSRGGGFITYSPANGFSGEDAFSVTISDALGASVDGQVTVAVGNPPPVGGGDPPPVTYTNGEVGLNFTVTPGATYYLQRSTDLSAWATIVTVVAGPDGSVSFTDFEAPADNAYYRLATP